MPFQNIKPVHVLWQYGITMDKLTGIDSGIKNILLLAGVDQEIKIQYCLQRRRSNWLVPRGPFNVLYLNEFQSFDWHIFVAGTPTIHSKVRGHLNSATLLENLGADPTHVVEPRYELAITFTPLHWNHASSRVIVGTGKINQGAVITLHPYLHLLYSPPDSTESAEEKENKAFEFRLITHMVTMHELGHVFGLWPGTTGPNATDAELKAAHCQNDCVMWWQAEPDLYKKIKNDPLCADCKIKLKKFFITP